MTSIQQLINAFGKILKLSIPLVVGIALLCFFIGLAKFIWNSGDTKKLQEGKDIMKWGIVALFVMVSIWGIIKVLRFNLLGTTSNMPSNN